MLRIARFLLLVTAACGSAPAHPVGVAPPPCAAATATTTPPPTTGELATSPAPGDPTDRARKRAEVLAELQQVDAELAAIDDELAASALDVLTLGDARREAARREALVAAIGGTPPTSPESWVLTDDAPRRVRSAVGALRAAELERATLGETYGPRHAKMERANHLVAHLATVARTALDDERAFAAAWVKSLAALAAKAGAAEIQRARLDALATVVASGATPTASPPALRLAADARQAATWALDDLALALGPKAPEHVAAAARLDDARRAFDAAVVQARSDLAERAAALRTAKRPAADARPILRRAELAERATDLRREYELLLGP